MNKKGTLFCLIGWSINLGTALLHVARGDLVSPWLVVLPEIVLVILYAKKLKE